MAQDNYDIEKTYTNFWGGISDDEGVGRGDSSVSDMDGIDVQTQERYAQCMDDYSRGQFWDMDPPIWMKGNNNSSAFLSDGTTIYKPTGGASLSTVGTAIGMEVYGTGVDSIGYIFGTTGIQRVDYSGTNIGSVITTNYPPGVNFESKIGWHVTNLLFSAGNKIHFVDTVNNIVSTNSVTLMPGTKVKYIYSYSYDSIIVVATNGNSTFVYELEFTGGNYSIVSRIERKSVLAISAVGNEYSIYIATIHGIYQYQGRQLQFIKYINLSAPQLGYDRRLIIIDNGIIYKLGNIKPGRNAILTKIVPSTGVLFIDGSTMLSSVYYSVRYSLILGTAPKRTNIIDLIISDGGINQIQKTDINFRLGYMFEGGSYTNAITKQEVEVLIQTDGMYMINSSNYLSVGKVTDSTDATGPDSIGNPKYGYLQINPQEVVKALQTALYPSTFGWVKIRLILKSGDEYAGNPGLYRKSPRLYDFTVKMNYVKR